MSAAVKVSGLIRRFGDRTVLSDVSFEIGSGEFVALIGKSGSGKSTLLRALARLDLDVQGSGALQVPQNCSVLFQDSRLLPWENVLDNITLGFEQPDAKARAAAALAQVGLAGREQAWPNALSGGEQQRVALARSLIRQPALLLADRVLVMEDGHIAKDIRIDLPRPRRATQPGFEPLRETLLAALGVHLDLPEESYA